MLCNFRLTAILLFIKFKYQLYFNNIFGILYIYIIFTLDILIISFFLAFLINILFMNIAFYIAIILI